MLVVRMRWMQRWCDFSIHVGYHSMFFVPHIGMIWFKPSTNPPKHTRASGMKKLEECYKIGKEKKSKSSIMVYR
jgi:hypothetical protein